MTQGATQPLQPSIGPYRARVLVCEDSEPVRRQVTWLLEPLYEVEAVATGEQAVTSAALFPPDLVLCEAMLPGISGPEVCRRIRAMPRQEAIPFVFLSSLDGEGSRELGLEAGADDYLTKPVHEGELLARVASLVRLRQTQRELEVRTRKLEQANSALRAFEANTEAERRAALAAIRGASLSLAPELSGVDVGLSALRTALEALANPGTPAEQRLAALLPDAERAVEALAAARTRIGEIVAELKAQGG